MHRSRLQSFRRHRVAQAHEAQNLDGLSYYITFILHVLCHVLLHVLLYVLCHVDYMCNTFNHIRCLLYYVGLSVSCQTQVSGSVAVTMLVWLSIGKV